MKKSLPAEAVTVTAPTPMSERLLRLPEVQNRTGLSKSTLYELIRAKSFPEPARLSRRAVGWAESAVTGWIASRLHANG